ISADKAVNSTNGPGFTALGNLVINEGLTSDFQASAGQTLVLTLPYGWRFNPGVGTVSYQVSRDITSATIVVTASNLTVTFGASGTTKSDILTIAGLQVQPLDGQGAPDAGYILRSSSNPGTAVIAGIQNDSTTFGLLNTLAGAGRVLQMATQPPST